MDPGTATLVGAGISAGANLIGGGIAAASNKKVQKRVWRDTKKLAQNQLQWRVQDARAAGIHPLAALGLPPAGAGGAISGGGGLAEGFSRAGESIGQGIAGYGQAKMDAKIRAEEKQRQQMYDTQAVLESQARIQESAARARASNAEADWTRAQLAASVAAQNAAPGKSGYEDNSWLGEDTSTWQTAFGAIPVNPNATPQRVMEDMRGGVVAEAYGVAQHLKELVQGANVQHRKAFKSFGEEFRDRAAKPQGWMKYLSLEQLKRILAALEQEPGRDWKAPASP